MRASLSVNQTTFRIDEPVVVTATVVNDGPEPARLQEAPVRAEHHVDGKLEDWTERHGGRAVTVAPGASATMVVPFEPAFDTHYRGRAALEPFAYDCVLRLGVDFTGLTASASFSLAVDFRDTRQLLTPDGAASRYIVDRDRLVYVSCLSRAYEPRSRVLGPAVGAARALDARYLVTDTAVFRNGRKVKKAAPRSFRLLSAVFAKDDGAVFTSYGDAKVEDPDSFEALDDGNCSIFHDPARPGYQAGFGRDDHHVYYFDESVDTPHAKRVKLASAPHEFVSLGTGYGKDARYVYLEHQRLKGADAATFHRISHWFWADARTVFCAGAALAGADPATFEVLDAGSGSAQSVWGRSGDRYFERAQPRTRAEYEAAVRK